MAFMILLAIVLFEAAFALACIRAKSLFEDARSYLRVGAFLAFAISVLASAIDWSFRWEGLAALLLVWAVVGGVRLILRRFGGKSPDGSAVKPGSDKQFTCARVLRKAILMALLAALALAPALVFPERKPIGTTGEYAVSTQIETYADGSRADPYSAGEARKLTVEFWYPENAAAHSCPLVVFSHGSFGVKTSNESLFRELASHGYVVCSIDHTYQCLFTTDTQGRTTWMDMGYTKEIEAEDARSDKQQSFAYYQKWMAVRTGDMGFVIDTILSKSAGDDPDPACRLVDAEKIGVMGHSLGGSAALGMGRLRGDVGAVVALEAPFLCDIEGVENGEFVFTDQAYPVPVLNVYSDASWSHLAEWPQYRENDALLSGARPDAANLHISGAGHLTLTDLALTSPLLTRVLNGRSTTIDAGQCLRELNAACLKFFDGYLK